MSEPTDKKEKPAHLYKPGQSGNPGGRPRGLMEHVRRQTKDGREIIAILLDILRNKKSAPEHRIQAARELLNRGFGRVPESEHNEVPTITLVMKPGQDFSRMPRYRVPPIPSIGDESGQIWSAAIPRAPGWTAPRTFVAMQMLDEGNWSQLGCC